MSKLSDRLSAEDIAVIARVVAIAHERAAARRAAEQRDSLRDKASAPASESGDF